MMEKPTENSYRTELVSTIKAIGEKMGFDAETSHKSPSGR